MRKSLLDQLKFSRVYCDLDNTLLIADDSAVNYKLVGFLYKELNNGKDLYLITKHKGSDKDLKKLLKKFKVNSLFSFKQDNVIHIDVSDHKYKYIKGDSILVDDSTYERNDASANGIVCVSPEAAIDSI